MNRYVALCLTAIWTAVPAAAGTDLSGYWQHESEPVWIEMIPDEGKGVVLRNDNKPDRVGFLVVTDLAPGQESNQWTAQVYAAQMGEYRDAEIKLEGEDLMSFTVKAGFIRRTVEWTRVQQVPSAANAE